MPDRTRSGTEPSRPRRSRAGRLSPRTSLAPPDLNSRTTGGAGIRTVRSSAPCVAQGAYDEAVEPRKGRNVREANLGVIDRFGDRNSVLCGDTVDRERLGDGEILVPIPRGQLHGSRDPLVPSERRELLHPRPYLGWERHVELVEAFWVRVGKQLDDAPGLRGEVFGGAVAQAG